MSGASRSTHGAEHSERVALHALRSLPDGERRAVEALISACSGCRDELAGLLPVVEALAHLPADGMAPTTSTWDRVVERIGARPARTGRSSGPDDSSGSPWREVAPGISVRMLSHDAERDVVAMLVRLAANVDYPPHRHAGVEELHLLDGELTIDERTYQPGDYVRAEPGSADRLVRSETGCTCLLVTSTKDALG
jgi:quercetin dioxygenase-like cupin family protein